MSPNDTIFGLKVIKKVIKMVIKIVIKIVTYYINKTKQNKRKDIYYI